ncbi:methyltransferase domain-containing protein [Microvirga sp. 2YAF29]
MRTVRTRVRTVLLTPYEQTLLSRIEGFYPRECCLCGFKGFFRGFGHPPRYDACCPQCESLERHRLLALWLNNNPDILKNGTTVLHFAPEEVVGRFVRRRTHDYKSADLEPGRADLMLNIEQIALPDASCDVIICFDVLEHVDDRKALKELMRVLRPNGIALLRTPFVESWSQTYENPQIQTPADRYLHFGQEDHVRYFGADVRDRIRFAGFQLEEFVAIEPDVSRYGLVRGETIFIARKLG